MSFISGLLLCLLQLLLLCPTRSSDITAITVLADVEGSAQLALADLCSAYILVNPNVTLLSQQQSVLASSISDIETGNVDFSTVAAGLTDAEAASYPALQMYPIFASALVPIYRLDALSLSIEQLVLSRTALAQIFLAEITWWNDTRLQSTNTIALPQQRITVMLPTAASSGRNYIFTTALSKFYSPFNLSIAPSTAPSWPYAQYYRWEVKSGATGQATAVIANDGSIGFAYQSTALQMGNDVAALINYAGNTVQANADSVTFAAVELGTRNRARATEFMDLTDGSGSSVWPITMMTFLLLDTQFSPTTCHVRAALVSFWLWFFTSSVATEILSSRQYAAVPGIVLSQLNVVSGLTTEVYCRGAWPCLQLRPPPG